MPKLSPHKAHQLQDLLAQGLSLLQGGDPQGACFSYEAALAIAPRHFETLHLLGIAYAAAGQSERACEVFKQALSLEPGSAAVHLNYGIALKATGQLAQALDHQHKAVRLQPRDANMHYNLANTLRDLGQAEEARDHYRQALAIKPDHADALNNLGILHERLGAYDQAILCVERLIALRSPLPYLHGRLCHLRALCCAWQEADASWSDLLARIDRAERAATPFALLPLPSSAAQQRHCAEIYAAAEFPPAAAPLWQGESYGHERIRLGYFSADFFDHATAFLMAELFERHDRTRFEVFAFAFDAPADSPMRARLAAGIEHFIDVSDLDDRAIAALARQHEIDIAIDLKGFTQHARSGIFAQRCAPVQVNYLGYPGSMGAPYIDYLIADRVLIPAGREGDYSEKVVRLPYSYQPNDRQRPIAATTPDRQTHGLPAEGFVFCCFNNNFKITPDVFAIWMRLLGAVAGSVLWLFEDNPYVAPNLRREAAARGIAPQRLVFAPRLPLAEHLARHHHADLFLDTFHYNAHTTASDALWAGLPLVTRAGATFASRVAASLLTACRLPELVTASAQEYETLCLALAQDRPRLRALRERLANTRDALPLFDTPAYTRHLESAYAQMHTRQQAGLAPTDLDIAP